MKRKKHKLTAEDRKIFMGVYDVIEDAGRPTGVYKGFVFILAMSVALIIMAIGLLVLDKLKL